ncbi:hypothetical protein ES703_95977 [subsurface metagenome]
MLKEEILKKVNELPPDLTQEVLDFIEFLKMKRLKKISIENIFMLI